jgi:hypothetical protein
MYPNSPIGGVSACTKPPLLLTIGFSTPASRGGRPQLLIRAMKNLEFPGSAAGVGCNGWLNEMGLSLLCNEIAVRGSYLEPCCSTEEYH